MGQNSRSDSFLCIFRYEAHVLKLKYRPDFKFLFHIRPTGLKSNVAPVPIHFDIKPTGLSSSKSGTFRAMCRDLKRGVKKRKIPVQTRKAVKQKVKSHQRVNKKIAKITQETKREATKEKRNEKCIKE